MLVRFVVFRSSLIVRIVVRTTNLLWVVLVLLLIVKDLQLICVVILILNVWIWLRICFVLDSVALALVRLLFMLILILINLIAFGCMIEMSFVGNKAYFTFTDGLKEVDFSLVYHPNLKVVSYDLLQSNLNCKQFSRVFSRCCKCFDAYYGIKR